ncbi:signal peptidase I [Dyadobacter chenhuakuii]|uniref:Signal peptidase I n=1 Tax=Dyadobacter chenhuakuii TaxID=2909339 RepID=A0ABY4XSJ4_9BACT|nr:signal peptidase I [Dyadobacter chenhuakuii]MCF2492611.1 signal peptidase I [Dyadobacter chenhuakuii]USJ33095.1 signal peptidase I [Dyadobacter chenhuakuii]
MSVTSIPRKPQQVKPKKSAFREWLDSVLFAVIAATLIRWLFFSAFVIPTSSMENSLLVGDYLFVSRLHYGTTTPVTPLQMPLTHQMIWGTKIPSYLDWIQLPQYRLPGFADVKRGDVVVFNLPVEHPNAYNKYSSVLPDLHPHPLDLRSNYIKRCVAIAGDKLEVRGGQVYVNGAAQKNPVRMQSEYFVSTSTPVNEQNVFRKNGITDFSQFTETFNDTIASNDQSGYIIKTTSAIAEKLKGFDFVKRIEPIYSSKGLKEPFLFPKTDLMYWNKDNYGPIMVPKEGLTIPMSPLNIALYGEIIRNYDGNDNVEIKEGEILQNGKVLTDYTFHQDYYFMMGDNRHNSADSRYWGFVPKDHIVGKAVFVWMSLDPDPVSFVNKIRWDRIFRIIE